MIRLENVSKTFDGGKSTIVRDISFQVDSGEILVLLGSSGSGKTTTLKMINRLIEPSSGEIYIDRQNILDVDRVELRRSMSYVFQGVGLFPHMTVEENVSIVLRLEKMEEEERLHIAWKLLEMVNLNPEEFARRFPQELSGGQQQRVGVARSLANNPKVLLMDEPFGALDAINRDALQQEVLRLKERLRKTIIFVTHDIVEAMRLGDRIAVMNHGRIEQIGTREELIQNPQTDFVKTLFNTQKQQLQTLTENFDNKDKA